MKIYAFQGYRYRSVDTDPGLLAAPPFDQIDDRLRDRLHAVSPDHFSHFTRPVVSGGATEYESAAAIHASWLENGIVGRDEEPSLYPYVVESADGTRRVSLCCLVAVGTTRKSDLRPHELTVERPLADRLALLRTTEIDPEPVMVLAEDDGSLEKRLQQDLEGLEPLVGHRDAAGNLHSLYRLDDPASVAAYQGLLAERGATIADGHHRCKTAQLYAEETGAAPGSAAAAKMAVLISVASQELEIAPIHRAIPAALDLEVLRRFAVETRPFEGDTGAALAAAVSAAQGPALGVRLAGRAAEIWRLDPSRAPDSTPSKARSLPAVLLHHMLLPAVGLEMASATDGTVLYRSDPDELYSSIDGGTVQTGFWLPPMQPQAFARAVSDGDVLPPKSTRFMPKLISGLVWAGHDAQLL